VIIINLKRNQQGNGDKSGRAYKKKEKSTTPPNLNKLMESMEKTTLVELIKKKRAVNCDRVKCCEL
jgi:hypothetical protein